MKSSRYSKDRRRSSPRMKRYYRLKSSLRRSHRRIRRSSRPSMGWKAASPHRGRERNALFKRCGSKCFLQPSTLGFPICTAKSTKCKPDSRGVLAALARAREWKYNTVATKARRIAKKMKLKWN